MPFRLSVLFSVRSDRLMQQVNKHRLAASHSKQLFILHLQNFYPFSLTLSLFIVRVTFLFCPSLFVFLPLFWERWTAHLRDLNIDIFGVTSWIVVKYYRHFGRGAAFIFWLEDEGSTFLRHAVTFPPGYTRFYPIRYFVSCHVMTCLSPTQST